MTPQRKSPDDETVNRHIGRRLALRRRQLGKTTAEIDAVLAQPAGRVAAFESGARRIDARDLIMLSRALDVPVDDFFAGLAGPGGGERRSVSEAVAEAARFVDAYHRIASARIRRDILGLVKAAGGGAPRK